MTTFFPFTTGAASSRDVLDEAHQEFLRQNVAGVFVFDRVVFLFEQVYDGMAPGLLRRMSDQSTMFQLELADLCDALQSGLP